MPIPETWRPVPTWEGLYEVSSHGRVRSLDRVSWVAASHYRPGFDRRYRGRILALSFDTFGYPMVKLKDRQRVELRRVHEAVALAFIGPRPAGKMVAHDDGNPANAWATNLRYDTQLGNVADKKRHGTYTVGQRHSRAKLTQAEVEAIRASKETQTAIAARFGITQPHVSHLKHGKRWMA